MKWANTEKKKNLTPTVGIWLTGMLDQHHTVVKHIKYVHADVFSEPFQIQCIKMKYFITFTQIYYIFVNLLFIDLTINPNLSWKPGSTSFYLFLLILLFQGFCFNK